MAVFNDQRTYGVELEINTRLDAHGVASEIRSGFAHDGIEQDCNVESYGHANSPQWKIVGDGSVSPGFEIVSPILNGWNGKAQIESVCRCLAHFGGRVWNSRQTGMHVHHGSYDLNGRELGYVFATYAAFQETFNMMVSPSRRHNQYAEGIPWNLLTNDGSYKMREEREDVMESIYRTAVYLKGGSTSAARYTSVNICSVFEQSRRMPQGHGTVEFRQHQGTANARKIWAWVLVTQSLIESAKEKNNYPKPLAVTDTMSNRGELNRLQTVCAVIPTYHVRQHNTSRGMRSVEPSIVEACTPYMEAYKYFAQRVRDFSRALVNENRALPSRRRASDDRDMDE